MGGSVALMMPRRKSRLRPLPVLLQRHAAPDNSDQQVKVPPMIDVDHIADDDVPQKYHVGDLQIGQPGALPEKQLEAACKCPHHHGHP